MEQVVQAAWGLAAAMLVALGGVLIPVVRDYAKNLLQHRIGEAAARVAGEIAAKVAADPNLSTATTGMIEAGKAALRERVPDAIAKLGVSDPTLRGMVAGEVGKLLAPAAAQVATVTVPPGGRGTVEVPAGGAPV